MTLTFVAVLMAAAGAFAVLMTGAGAFEDDSNSCFDDGDLRFILTRLFQHGTEEEKKNIIIHSKLEKHFDGAMKQLEHIYKLLNDIYYINLIVFKGITTRAGMENELNEISSLNMIITSSMYQADKLSNELSADVKDLILKSEYQISEIGRYQHGISTMFSEMKGSIQCMDGWISYNRSCYLISVTKRNFTDAAETCITFASHLVWIESEEENSFLRNVLTVMKDGWYWMGISDLQTEGTWLFYGKNTVPAFFDWDHGQPDDWFGKEDCVQYRIDYDYKWNDLSCDYEIYSICEKEILY